MTDDPADALRDVSEGDLRVAVREATWVREAPICPTCHERAVLLGRRPWRVYGGVSAVGYCPVCFDVLIQWDNPEWAARDPRHVLARCIAVLWGGRGRGEARP